MSLRQISTFLHWSARFLGLLTAGIFFVFLIGEGSIPGSTHPFVLPTAREAVLLTLLIGAAFALLLAWRWEKLGGLTAAALGSVFFLYCLLNPGMHRVWFLGVALALPGLLFAMAARLNREHPQGQ